jgi:hypothetical protein
MNQPVIINPQEGEKAPLPKINSVKASLIKMLQEASDNEQDLLNKLKDFVFMQFPEIPKRLEEKKDLANLPHVIESESNIETSENDRQTKEKENDNVLLGRKRKKDDKSKEEKDANISDNSESFSKLNSLVKKYHFKNVIKALYKSSFDEAKLPDDELQKIINEIGTDKLTFMLLDIVYNKDVHQLKNKDNIIALDEKNSEKNKEKEKEKEKKKERTRKKEGSSSKPFSIRKNGKNNPNSAFQKIQVIPQQKIDLSPNVIQPEKKDENLNKNNFIQNPIPTPIINNNNEIIKPTDSKEANEPKELKETKEVKDPKEAKVNVVENAQNEKQLDKDNNNIQRGGSSSRFRKELGLGVHFHKDENDNIYKYCLHHFLGETRAIFYCSDKQCKSIAKYDVESKDFAVTIPHSKPHAQHNYILNFDTEKKDKIIFLDFQKKDYKEGQVFRKGEGKRIVQWYTC